MIELHHLPVGAIVPRKRHRSLLCRLHWSPRRDTNVEPRMELRPSTPHRVLALAEGRSQLTLDWPDETLGRRQWCLGGAFEGTLQGQPEGDLACGRELR